MIPPGSIAVAADVVARSAIGVAFLDGPVID
jgi:hypothetical protein